MFPNIQHFSSFGFGRRICPGMHIAERSLYLLTARIAWACDWTKARDASGKPMRYPEYDYVEGFNVQPKPFPFDLKARGSRRWDIVKRMHGLRPTGMIYCDPDQRSMRRGNP